MLGAPLVSLWLRQKIILQFIQKARLNHSVDILSEAKGSVFWSIYFISY